MARRGSSCEICMTPALFWPWANRSMWPGAFGGGCVSLFAFDERQNDFRHGLTKFADGLSLIRPERCRLDDALCKFQFSKVRGRSLKFGHGGLRKTREF